MKQDNIHSQTSRDLRRLSVDSSRPGPTYQRERNSLILLTVLLRNLIPPKIQNRPKFLA